MPDLWKFFSEIVKENKLLLFKDGKIILKGGENKNKYNTTILAKKSDGLAVFNVGKNSHASFVMKGYNKNCDYIFIQIDEKIINFTLCELKKSNNNAGSAFEQLKCSIPLAHYLKQLLITHCSEEMEYSEITCKKVLLIKEMSQKQTMKNKPEFDEDNNTHIFYGDKFYSKELLTNKSGDVRIDVGTPQ